MASTANTVFALTGIMHFLVSVSSIMMVCGCHTVVVGGLAYGGTFVPSILLVNRINKTKSLCMTISASCVCTAISFLGGIWMRAISNPIYEDILFISFIHGIIIPGVVSSAIEVIRQH